MSTIDALVKGAVARLAALRGRCEPAREARFLLAAALGRTETWLLAHGDTEVDEETSARFLAWVERRSAGEPAHLILGTCPFWGRSFLVSPATLIPRPETELLVETALALNLPPSPRAADIGTGTGCLAVTLALELPAARVLATDRSVEAAALARRNARRLGAGVGVAAGDLARHLRAAFDLVTANLPYVPSAEIPGLQPEVRDFEPALALDGGPRGTDFVLALVDGLPRLLAPGGVALLELGPGQADTVSCRAAASGLEETGRIVDPGGVERVIVLRNPRGRRAPTTP